MNDEGLAVLSILVGLAISIAYLYGWHMLCSMFSNIANSKGYGSSKYYWLSFFFGLPAMLLIVSIQSKPAQNTPKYVGSENTNTQTIPQNTAPKSTTAPKNKIVVVNGQWECPKCGENNPISRVSCNKCATYR